MKNISREGPGILKEVLEGKNLDFKIIEVQTGEDFPSLKNCAALIVLGGPDSANSKSEKMLKEISYVQKALLMRVPYLGVCLGLQVLVKAAGGSVIKSPVKEIGFRDHDGKYFEVKLTKEGKIDPIFENFPEEFKVFQLHGEMVKLSKDMRLLGKGRFCRNQVVRVGENAYGIQGHLEVTRKMLLRWVKEDYDLKKLNTEKLIEDFERIYPEFSLNGRRFFQNFLNLCGF